MATKTVRDESLKAVADAIRAAEGGTSELLTFPDGFVDAIGELGSVTIVPLDVTENGTYTAQVGQAYSPVYVDVETGAETEPISITENGTYTAPEGTAYTPVTVAVPEKNVVNNGVLHLDFGDVSASVSDVAGKATVRTLKIGSGISLLSGSLFRDCTNLTSIQWLDAPTEIGTYCFQNVGISGALVIPDGLTVLNQQAFAYNTGITSVTLPSTLVAINKWYPFKGCTGITTVTFGVKPTSFAGSGYDYFQNCTALTSINAPWAKNDLTTENYKRICKVSGQVTYHCTDGDYTPTW